MIFPKAKKIAREHDWQKTKNGVFGLYKGYFFEVSDAGLLTNPQAKHVVATTGVLTEEQALQLRTELDANKKALKFSVFEVGDTDVEFKFIENMTFTKTATVYALFDFLVDLFKKLGIPEQNKCHQCGTKENTAYYDINNRGGMLCHACFRRTEADFSELERKKFLEEKNYLQGFFGSLAFSTPGIVAWVLLAVFMNRIVSLMAVLIAYLGIKGYQYFKGKQGKLTKYVVVFSNIVCIVIANIATIIIMLMREGLTLEQSFIELQTNEIAKSLLYQNTVLSFVLASVAWIWLLVSLRDKKLSVKPAEKMKK